MAQYWYKQDKRIKKISEDDNDKDVIKQIAELKANGYVKIKDRYNPSELYHKAPKPKPKSKPKKKSKKK
jgi:hypothetical protein